MLEVMSGKESKNRCEWCLGSQLYIDYHDHEWGVPVHDDRKHFEFLILEGAQAGLSWSTILNKREGYREAFNDFDPESVAQFTEEDIEALLQNEKIVRNKLKVRSAVNNARCFLETQKEFGSFDNYIWSFVEDKPIINHWHEMKELPATSRESDALSKDLRKRGYKFVGSTIVYAHMQACGLVNDHVTSCFRYLDLI